MKMNSTLKVSLIFISAAIAAAATFPYGYKFAKLFHLSDPTLHLALAYLLGATAYLANIVLGSYSLLNIKAQQEGLNVFVITSLSVFGAVPVGFFSYAGYKNTLPLSLNILVSLVVVIVNTAINYTAIFNLLVSSKEFIKNLGKKALNRLRLLLCTVGGTIGALVSLTAYLSTTNGLAEIFLYYHLTPIRALEIAALLAVVIWLPFGALYVNSTQAVIGSIYDFFTKKNRSGKQIKLYNFALILFVLLAGGAFAQMVLDFYDPHNIIPAFFKLPLVQTIAYYWLMPMALLSSASVNYFALVRVIQYAKEKMK